MQIKHTWMQCSKLFSSKNVAKIVDFLYFSFFSFLRTLLISPLLLWEKMEFPVACRHLGVLGSRHVSPSTVLLLSFPLRRRRTHSEDSRKQKLELCVLLQLSELLPHTARQGKRKAGHQAHCLQGKCGQARAHTPQSNKQPFKAQKTTEFIFLALKIQKQDGIEFLIAAQGSCAASVRCDAVFQAGGHCRRAQLHQMEFKALLSNVIHSLFPGGKKAKK